MRRGHDLSQRPSSRSVYLSRLSNCYNSDVTQVLAGNNILATPGVVTIEIIKKTKTLFPFF